MASYVERERHHGPRAWAARPRPRGALDEPVADGGASALDLLEPQPDRPEPDLGIGLGRDDEGVAVTLGAAACWRSMKARPESSV